MSRANSAVSERSDLRSS